MHSRRHSYAVNSRLVLKNVSGKCKKIPPQNHLSFNNVDECKLLQLSRSCFNKKKIYKNRMYVVWKKYA